MFKIFLNLNLNLKRKTVKLFLGYLILSGFLSLGLVGKVHADAVQDMAKQAELAFQNENFERAEVLWIILSKQYPTNIVFQNNLAVLEIKRGEIDKAKERLEQTLLSQSRVGVLVSNLNQIYAYEAQKAYQKVFKSTGVTKPKPQLIVVAEKTDLTGTQLKLEEWDHTQQKILNTLEGWRSAWAAQDVEAYLSFYKEGFRPDSGASHANWLRDRNRKLTNPRFIRLGLSEIKISPVSFHKVRVSFLQSYQSDTFRSTARKVILWERDLPTSENWKITQEKVIYAR